MRRSFCLALVLVFAIPALASAVTVYQDGKTFNVRVENRHFKTINNARATVYISGTQARITATADGYRDRTGYVYLREGTTYYSTSIRLDDLHVNYRVQDAAGQNLSGVTLKENNFVVQGDKFRFELRVPAEGHANFDRFDVDLRVNYGFVFGETIWVYDLGDVRVVEITVDRRNLDRMFNDVVVAIPTDEQLQEHRRNVKRAILDHVQKNELSEEQREELLKRIADR